MPAKLAHACILAAVVCMALAPVSLCIDKPILGFYSRHLGGAAALLLLLALNFHHCAAHCLKEKG